MNINFETREILSRTPALEVFITERWTDLIQIRKESYIKQMMLDRASSLLANKFAEFILSDRKSDWQVQDEHDGLKLRLVAYSLTRQQMAELLEETWLAGQKNGLSSRPHSISI